MLYTVATVAHRDGPRRTTERAMDQVLADSFPASDPPSWTLGIARVDALFYGQRAERDDIVDVSRSRDRGRRWVHSSAGGAIGIVLLIPFALLLAGAARRRLRHRRGARAFLRRTAN